MCRALLYLGEPVLLDNFLYQPDSALVRQSTMPRMLNMLNLAGFGMRAVFLEVDEDNKPARKLYARAEFREVGRRPGYYSGGKSALVLRRDLV